MFCILILFRALENLDEEIKQLTSKGKNDDTEEFENQSADEDEIRSEKTTTSDMSQA